MREVIKRGAFTLLIIGTLGLLINEFACDWGRCATLTLAALNVIGLAALALTHWGTKRET